MVFVLDRHKKPLPHGRPKRARLLLRGRAVVHPVKPFIIRLRGLAVRRGVRDQFLGRDHAPPRREKKRRRERCIMRSFSPKCSIAGRPSIAAS